MKVYLAKFTKDEKIMYKIGHTKWFYPIKRFKHVDPEQFDEQYKFFDNIEIIADILVNHEYAETARSLAKYVEITLQAMYPKNLWLEAYFHTDKSQFDNMSGITECFVLEEGQTEKQLIKMFERINKSIQKIDKKEKELYESRIYR